MQDADEVLENDSAEQVIRTKGEKESTEYPLPDQEEHSLEICFLCWALFEGIQQAPEFGNRGLFEGSIERKAKKPLLYTRNQWATSKSKIYDTFNESVSKMHHSKYLHFLFGRVEIIRGQRLQKLFFLVPKAIRTLKSQSLLKDWQETPLPQYPADVLFSLSTLRCFSPYANCCKRTLFNSKPACEFPLNASRRKEGCINSVDRSGPEAKLQDFSEQIEEYIGFVEHQPLVVR